MIKMKTLEHEFVDILPSTLEPGTLYISMEYRTAVHSCFCGCGNEVVTPFTPTDWKLIYDGDTVSLKPSVGNWNQPCRSHYVIKRNSIVWAGSWTEKQIEAERMRDQAAKQMFYGTNSEPSANIHVSDEVPINNNVTLWQKIKGWILGS